MYLCQDFTEMIIHHIATITLMGMSWSANMIRVGTLVLCVHDAVDYILEVITCSILIHNITIHSNCMKAGCGNGRALLVTLVI